MKCCIIGKSEKETSVSHNCCEINNEMNVEMEKYNKMQ